MTTKKPAAPQSSPLIESDRTRTSVHLRTKSGRALAVVVGDDREELAALIVRRVNQGPAFDAMEKALAVALPLAEHYAKHTDGTALVFVDQIRAALKLAQEVR